VDADGDLALEIERGGRLPLDQGAIGRVHAVTESDRASELASLLVDVDYVVSYSVGTLAEGEGNDFIPTGVNVADLDQAHVTRADAD
jgi:hypothetical protein